MTVWKDNQTGRVFDDNLGPDPDGNIIRDIASFEFGHQDYDKIANSVEVTNDPNKPVFGEPTKHPLVEE